MSARRRRQMCHGRANQSNAYQLVVMVVCLSAYCKMYRVLVRVIQGGIELEAKR